MVLNSSADGFLSRPAKWLSASEAMLTVTAQQVHGLIGLPFRMLRPDFDAGVLGDVLKVMLHVYRVTLTPAVLLPSWHPVSSVLQVCALLDNWLPILWELRRDRHDIELVCVFPRSVAQLTKSIHRVFCVPSQVRSSTRLYSDLLPVIG